MKALAVILLAGFLTACATSMPPDTGPNGHTPETYTVNIFWKDGSDCEVDRVEAPSTECEKNNDSVENDKSDFCVHRGDFIDWQSNEPSNAKFAIYFDPIRGGNLHTGGGTIHKRIDDSAPVAYYKYSIVRSGCDPNDVNTFDPRIRIDP